VSQSTSPAIFNTTGVDFLGVAMADTVLIASWTSDVSPPYTVRVGGVSVAAQLLSTPPPPVSSPRALRTLGIATKWIRLSLGRPMRADDSFAVLDMTGRRIAVRASATADIVELHPEGELAAGLYFVQWRSETGAQHVKVVVLR
jgi:hypothetical protein